jgi:hypothetical protein
MSIYLNNDLFSDQSVIVEELRNAPLISVGKFHPIDLPHVNFDKISQTFGAKIAEGDCGSIWQVQKSSPQRVYKVIPAESLQSGDEIRVSKIAGDLGIAPTFYSASVIANQSKNYVFVEMDDAGRSLGAWTEELSKHKEVEKVSEEAPILTEKERKMQEMLKRLRSKMEEESGFVVREVVKKNRVSIEEAVENLYGSQEAFYFQLFSKIRVLAEHQIAYTDSHVGNIMPNHRLEKGMQLIDFDGAKITNSTREAIDLVTSSVYNQVHLKQFRALSNLSEESRELLRFFTS